MKRLGRDFFALIFVILNLNIGCNNSNVIQPNGILDTIRYNDFALVIENNLCNSKFKSGLSSAYPISIQGISYYKDCEKARVNLDIDKIFPQKFDKRFIEKFINGVHEKNVSAMISDSLVNSNDNSLILLGHNEESVDGKDYFLKYVSLKESYMVKIDFSLDSLTFETSKKQIIHQLNDIKYFRNK